MTQATACLLNWKRPQNIGRTIASCREQGAAVFLWNNNPEDKTRFPVDWQVDSSINRFCMPRWWLASMADTEYVFSLDDDLAFARQHVIRDCIALMETLPEDAIIGRGAEMIVGSDGKSISMNRERKIDRVDIIKGSFLFTRKTVVQSMFLRHDLQRGDDIFVSSHSKNKQVPDFMHDAFIRFENGAESLCKNSRHYIIRREASRRYHL